MCVFAFVHTGYVFGFYLPPCLCLHLCISLCMTAQCVWYQFIMARRELYLAVCQKQRKQNPSECSSSTAWFCGNENYCCRDSPLNQQGTLFPFRGVGNVVIVMASFEGHLV